MTAFPAQHSYSASEALTSANLNTHPNGINWLLSAKPHLFVHQTVSQSTANNTWTTLICDFVDVDTETGYNNTTGIYTVAQPGWYLVNSVVVFAANATGDRAMHVTASYGQVPGVALSPAVSSQAYETCLSYSALCGPFVAGNTIKVQMLQTSTVSLSTAVTGSTNGGNNAQSFLDIQWIRGT